RTIVVAVARRVAPAVTRADPPKCKARAQACEPAVAEPSVEQPHPAKRGSAVTFTLDCPDAAASQRAGKDGSTPDEQALRRLSRPRAHDYRCVVRRAAFHRLIASTIFGV